MKYEGNLNYEDTLKYEDNLIYEDNLWYNDDLKYEHNLKNGNLIMYFTSIMKMILDMKTSSSMKKTTDRQSQVISTKPKKLNQPKIIKPNLSNYTKLTNSMSVISSKQGSYQPENFSFALSLAQLFSNLFYSFLVPPTPYGIYPIQKEFGRNFATSPHLYSLPM